MSVPKGWRNPHINDLSGRVFGRLTVISRGENFGVGVGWLCQCKCGNVKNVRSACLRKGYTLSCGCYHRDRTRESHLTHGMSRKPEYQAWNHMIQRCYNERTCNFTNYGGRGISVCVRWRKSFLNFFKDMGKKPSPKHSIDRLDNSKGYSPSNCRWSDQFQQASNKRGIRDITFLGETMCLKAWCRKLNLRYKNTHKRIFIRGWDVERAFTVVDGNKCKLRKTEKV
jgi:hypothetical protein